MLVIVGHILLSDVRKIVEIRVVKKSKTEKKMCKEALKRC